MKSITRSSATGRFGLLSRAGAAMAILILFGSFAPEAGARFPGFQDAGRQAVVEVDGLACPFCAYGIRKHLLRLPGAEDVRVELAESRVVVDFEPGAEVTEAQIQEAVRNAGFSAANIEWRSRTGAAGDPS